MHSPSHLSIFFKSQSLQQQFCREGCVAARCSIILKITLKISQEHNRGAKPVLGGQPGLLHHKISAVYPCGCAAVLQADGALPSSACKAERPRQCCPGVAHHPVLPAASLTLGQAHSCHIPSHLFAPARDGAGRRQGTKRRSEPSAATSLLLSFSLCELICSSTLLHLHAQARLPQGCSLGGHILAYKTSIVIEICRYWELESVFISHLRHCRGSRPYNEPHKGAHPVGCGSRACDEKAQRMRLKSVLPTEGGG